MLGTKDTLQATEVNPNEVVFVIVEILVYPFSDDVGDDDDATLLYDYSLLKTHDEVNFTKFVKPACLYHTDPPVNWEELFFTGFGGNYNRAVKRVKFPLIYSDESPSDKRDGNCVSHSFDQEDPYYSRFGASLPHIICGKTKAFSGEDAKYPSPCEVAYSNIVSSSPKSQSTGKNVQEDSTDLNLKKLEDGISIAEADMSDGKRQKSLDVVLKGPLCLPYLRFRPSESEAFIEAYKSLHSSVWLRPTFIRCSLRGPCPVKIPNTSRESHSTAWLWICQKGFCAYIPKGACFSLPSMHLWPNTKSRHDEGGPLQFRVPIPYCMYQVYAVLSLKRSKCDSPSSMSAFQSVKFAMSKIEDIVWKYPFLEDFPIPFANPTNFKTPPLWYVECESKRCPTIEIVKKHLREEPNVLHKTNYNITTARDLNKGILPEVFDESSLVLGNQTLCDVERYDKGESLAFKQAVYKYIPAFCVDEYTTCTSTFGGKHSKEACKRDDKVCCSVANQPAITGTLDHHINLIAHDDLFGYKFNDDVVVTGEAQREMTDDQYLVLQHEQIREVLEKETVCGIKTYIYPNNQTFLTPFFCTTPNNCVHELEPKERKKRLDRSAWFDICRRGSEFDSSLSGKTSCCHPSDMKLVDYVKNSVKWEFRELPTYLKYAPGLRSAYKCEEYYRYVCENVNNWCVHYQEDDFAIPGEIPHMAQIGFIVPKMMLFYCGGAIISPRYVISSTTCGMEREIVANVVLVGDFNRTILIDNPGWEKLYQLREILPYPFKRKLRVSPRGVLDNNLRDFILDNGRNNDRFVDLALYRTIDDIVFSPRIRPICLYYYPVNKIDLAWFTGFGYLPADKEDLRTYYKGNHFKRTNLMKVAEVYINRGLDLTLLPHEERFKEARKRWDECKNPLLFKKDIHHPYYTKYGVADHYLFCGENTNPLHGPCRYDNGGPLQLELTVPYCSSQLLGVLSVGHFRCNDTNPLVYVNVTKFLKEIEDVVYPYPFLDFINEGTPKCLSQHSGGVNSYTSLLHIDP
ncbi:serine-type endopeptidase activity protein [Homalodisca vitripennis]|nr:serine-type endopeptidase activity protein [Homalodisca vitripennis]